MPKRYVKDLSTRGRPYKVIAISLPIEDLAELDDYASQHGMARSHAIREAVKRLRTAADQAA